MNPAIIVVLDTNVWISGLQFAKLYGTPTQAIELAMSRDLLATCAEIEDELHRILPGKFRWEAARVKLTLDRIQARAIRVQLQGNVSICRDPKDNMFLECAMLANADLLVAGDKDLLGLIALSTHALSRLQLMFDRSTSPTLPA